MSKLRLVCQTILAMLAVAGNYLLCRAPLERTDIDAASFTTIRLLSGAVMLWMIVRLRAPAAAGAGNWFSAFALFAYAAGFSFAYLSLSAATGALLLFAAVQATMVGHGLWRGERLMPLRWTGLMLAMCGLVLLLSPGLAAPSPQAAVMMLCAGIAWGVYSLRGKGKGDPFRVTAGNFLRAVAFSTVLSLSMSDRTVWDASGVGYAIVSAGSTSGLGYAVWYTALPALKANQAATIQLSVPLIAAFGAVLLLGEPATVRLVLASVAIVGGIALTVLRRSA